MATARRPATTPSREIYASKLRTLIETYLHTAPGACPWPAQLAAVGSGAVVECHGFMAGLGPGRWRLDADGTATPVPNSI